MNSKSWKSWIKSPPKLCISVSRKSPWNTICKGITRGKGVCHLNPSIQRGISVNKLLWVGCPRILICVSHMLAMLWRGSCVGVGYQEITIWISKSWSMLHGRLCDAVLEIYFLWNSWGAKWIVHKDLCEWGDYSPKGLWKVSGYHCAVRLK